MRNRDFHRFTAGAFRLAIALSLGSVCGPGPARAETTLDASATSHFYDTIAQDSYSKIYEYSLLTSNDLPSQCARFVHSIWNQCEEKPTCLFGGPQDVAPCIHTFPVETDPRIQPEDEGFNYFRRPLPVLGLCFERCEAAWVPESEARRGTETVATYEQQASSGAPFDCGQLFDNSQAFNHARWQKFAKVSGLQDPYEPTADQCLLVVRAPLSDREHVLSLCSVRVTTDKALPIPKKCTLVALVLNTKTWVRVVTAFHLTQPATLGNQPDWGASLTILGSLSQKSSQLLLTDLDSILTGTPFSLKTIPVGTNGRLGAVPNQASQIIKTYRERVEEFVFVIAQPQSTEVRFWTTLYVSKQNTSDPSDWHAPDEEQMFAYINAINDAAKTPIQRLCRGTWTSSATFQCTPSAEPARQ